MVCCKHGLAAIIFLVVSASLLLYVAVGEGYFTHIDYRRIIDEGPHFSYINSTNTRDDAHCPEHPHLCWLRNLISYSYGQPFKKKLYDLSTLYKFKTDMFLDNTNFLGPGMKGYTGGAHLYNTGAEMLNAMKLERLLTGNKLELLRLPNNRTCEYDPHKYYKYNFRIYHQQENINVYVDETLLKDTKSESRGMNDIFGVIKTNITVSACELVDYFSNHTYHIICPILETDFQISINAIYLGISTSVYTCNPNPLKQLKNFTSADIRQSRAILKPETLVNKCANMTCDYAKGHDKGFWCRIGQRYHWATSSCHYSFLIAPSTLKCLRTKKVFMFGDSHMFYRQIELRSTYNLSNFEYHVTSHSPHLLRELLLTYQDFLSGTKSADILVVNAAMHDFKFLDIITYITTMSDIFTMFKRFLALEKPPIIIWVETYPLPFSGSHGHFMAKLVVQGTNDWIDHNMRKLGIEILHSFDIAIAMESHSRDGNHFYDSFGPKMTTPNGKVSVGGAVISVLMNMICPDVNTKTGN